MVGVTCASASVQARGRLRSRPQPSISPEAMPWIGPAFRAFRLALQVGSRRPWSPALPSTRRYFFCLNVQVEVGPVPPGPRAVILTRYVALFFNLVSRIDGAVTAFGAVHLFRVFFLDT